LDQAELNFRGGVTPGKEITPEYARIFSLPRDVKLLSNDASGAESENADAPGGHHGSGKSI
jgi:hypothetical protein